MNDTHVACAARLSNLGGCICAAVVHHQNLVVRGVGLRKTSAVRYGVGNAVLLVIGQEDETNAQFAQRGGTVTKWRPLGMPGAIWEFFLQTQSRRTALEPL